MFATQYNGGGGFTASQSSQATDSGAFTTKRDSQGLVPVTIKQISDLSYSGDDKSTFLIGAAEVTNVSVVGMVSNRAEQKTNIVFTLDDGTGQIDCNRWINDGFDTKEMEEIQDGVYARVNGKLKKFQDKKTLVAFSVRPVTNFDEVSFHFIECIHFSAKNSGTQVQGDSTMSTLTESQNTPSQNTSNYQTSLPTNVAGDDVLEGLKLFEQQIVKYLQQPSNAQREKGVHVDELVQKLKLSKDQIMASLRILEDEGLIYSTVDEFHFKSTTCS